MALDNGTAGVIDNTTDDDFNDDFRPPGVAAADNDNTEVEPCRSSRGRLVDAEEETNVGTT